MTQRHRAGRSHISFLSLINGHRKKFISKRQRFFITLLLQTTDRGQSEGTSNFTERLNLKQFTHLQRLIDHPVKLFCFIESSHKVVLSHCSYSTFGIVRSRYGFLQRINRPFKLATHQIHASQ